jgi:prepilin-type N-terminal cleavage/methylation domain-containing protein
MKISSFISSKKAFTLIEVIISLVLIGIMAVLVGVGVVKITQGYVFARQNTDTLLKTQVGMVRIVKELSSIHIETDSIAAADATSISYTKNGVSGGHTIARAGTVIQIDGIILVDNVTAFDLKYFDAASTELTRPVSNSDRPKIRRVDISLSLQGAQNVVSTFGNSAKIQESYW